MRLVSFNDNINAYILIVMKSRWIIDNLSLESFNITYLIICGPEIALLIYLIRWLYVRSSIKFENQMRF